MRENIIAIDGPAASGKGTVAKLLANHFKYELFTTGNLYRVLAKKVIEQNCSISDTKKIVALANSITSNELYKSELNHENIGLIASQIASIAEIREVFYKIQRNFIELTKGAVIEGRDIGTVICPEAKTKIFLTASLHKRAERRFKDLKSKGVVISFEQVKEDLIIRDLRDKNRELSPLKAAKDAFIIDNSTITPEQTFELILEYIRNKPDKDLDKK